MKKRSVMLGVSFFLVLSFCGIGVAGEYKVDVPRHSQEQLVFCGVAVAQCWSEYLTGEKHSQYYLATLYPEVWGGVSAGNLKTILESRTGKGFQINDHYSESSAFKRIREELKDQKKPLAIAGNACSPSGTPKTPMKHWMLIEGLRMDSANKVFQGSYVDDPLYGSSFASSYEALRPRTWVRDLFIKWWLPKNDLRQSVDD